MLFAAVFLLVALSTVNAQCDRSQYTKFGCFARNRNVFPDMLASNRDSTSQHFIGTKVNWKNYQESLTQLACACLDKVKEGGYQVFALGFYGECFAGKDKAAFDAMLTGSKSAHCIAHDFGKCDDNDSNGHCIGGSNAEYVYSLPAKAPEPVNGGLSVWSEYSGCTASCGEGFQQRERACNNPVPQNGGNDCNSLGPLTETKSCKLKECPVDGGYTDWEEYSECSVSCGGGLQSRSRSCTSPAPVHGGKDCEGPATEEQQCNQTPCPINGGYSDWEEYSKCSASCGGGSQSRLRSCNNPVPAHGGKDCEGSATEEQTCNVNPCPIDGGYTAWGSYGSCSKPCGGGTQTRSRSCTNPAPKYNGKACVGSSTDSSSCNTHNCPIDGVLSSWSSYGPCSKSCGDGYKTKTRTCTGPFHGGKACVGSLTQTQSCGTEICLVSSDLENRMKNLMSSYQSQSHSTFSYTLKNSLSSTYPSYYFTVSVYNPCTGYETHTVRGNSYVAIFRQYNRNVVVTYTKKTSSFPSSSKRTEIKNAVISEITKKARSAKTSNDLAWAKAKSYGFPIASVHVVRFGNGLRSAVGSYADFQNFVCERSCNWLGSCTNHESSLVIVFGSA